MKKLDQLESQIAEIKPKNETFEHSMKDLLVEIKKWNNVIFSDKIA
jgi:predicted  nucleic acid-binding Zn-ribbon protein